MNSEFSFRRSGSRGCEILFKGVVIAWTADELWAAWIVHLLNNDPCVRLAQGKSALSGLLSQEGLTAKTHFEHIGTENE